MKLIKFLIKKILVLIFMFHTFNSIESMEIETIGENKLEEELTIPELLKFNGFNIMDDINAIDQYGTTALMWASDENHKDIVEYLIQNGADVNFKSSNRNDTALMLACDEDYIEIVELLLKNGANPNIKNIDGNTSLMLAAINGYKEIVELLIKYGANVNDKNNQNKTALNLANDNDYDRSEIINLLSKHSNENNNQ